MANTLTSLDAALRYVQKEGMLDLRPASSIVYDMAPMSEADMLGRNYLQTVCLSHELGFTFGDGTAFTYNDDVAAVYDEISINPNPVVLKSRLAIEAADRLIRSDKAAITQTGLRAVQMKTSILRMAEIEMLHGRTGVGTISGNPSVNTSPTPDQATIVFTDATWAPGVWAGMTGALLEARNGATKVNANGDLTLVSVDHDAKSIVVSGDNTDLTDLADGHVVYFKGAYSNGQYGIKYQLDTSGSVFGIDSSVYDLWKAQEHTVSGALTVAQVMAGVAKATARGGLDEDCVLLMSTKTMSGLSSDLAALRELDGSYSPDKVSVGSKGIVVQAGSVRVRCVGHPMVMEGDAFLLPEKGLRKIGSTDITFADSDGREARWQHLEGSHAYQLTCRFSFQVLISEPAKCVYFKSITNS